MKGTTMLKGALFDLDGIIADTASYHFDAWKKLIKNHFDTDLPNQLEEKTKGVSREDSLSIILDYLGIQVSEENFKQLAAEKNEQYVQALDALTSQDILPGISDFIQELRKAKIRIALASASKNGPIILEKLGLLDVFDAIVDPSSVAKGKPAPDIFLVAAQALDLQPKECIGIEDSIAGITAINKAGSFSVACGGDELHHALLRFPSTADLNLHMIQEQFH
jgi:beta-phosphoglucomutase